MISALGESAHKAYMISWLSILGATGGEQWELMRIEVLVALFLLSVLVCAAFAGVRPVNADFDLSNAAYYDRVNSVLGLTPAQQDMLRQYGFVTVSVPNMTTFENFYGDVVWQHDLPVIVTTDSFLQLFHVVFDCSLRIL
jgi:hypothetical protein